MHVVGCKLVGGKGVQTIEGGLRHDKLSRGMVCYQPPPPPIYAVIMLEFGPWDRGSRSATGEFSNVLEFIFKCLYPLNSLTRF